MIEGRFPGCSLADAGPDLRRLRRIKDPDEVQVLRRLAAIAEAGYARAREILRPGISEVEVYVSYRRR